MFICDNLCFVWGKLYNSDNDDDNDDDNGGDHSNYSL